MSEENVIVEGEVTEDAPRPGRLKKLMKKIDAYTPAIAAVTATAVFFGGIILIRKLEEETLTESVDATVTTTTVE